MSARSLMCVYAGLTMLAACSTSYYAQFPPLAADVQGTRVERPQFSIVVPRDFVLREMPGDGGHLNAFEQPPDNGEHRLYRTLVVAPVAGMAEDDPERMAERAYALLAKRHEGDSLQVRQTGRARLADRDCWFLQGRIAGASAGWFFEVLEFLVPGDPQSLVVSFLIPEGQLEASRAGFVATAATLQTKLAMPKDGAAGALVWHDGDRLGLRLPAVWQRQADGEGALAVFTQASGARCDLSTATAKTAVGFDLDNLARGYVGDQGKEWPGLRLLSLERRAIDGRTSLRVRAAFQDGDGTVVVDDTFVTDGKRIDRLLFRVPHGEYVGQRSAIERAVASLRWK